MNQVELQHDVYVTIEPNGVKQPAPSHKGPRRGTTANLSSTLH